jgi:3-oxoacyl-[acyl-carrier protein] reductase
MLPIDLTGKIAVVTGASGQLGRVLARTLARCGADVALHYFRHPDAARSLCEELQALGVQGMMVQADITQPESIQAMRAAIMRTLGAPHILMSSWPRLLSQR